MSSIGESLIHLRQGSYHWISVKVFSTKPGLPGDQVLKGLIGQPDYRDLYLGPSPDESDPSAPPGLGRSQVGFIGVGQEPPGEFHGPYRIDAMEITDFVPLSPEHAESEVRRYSAEYEAPPGALSEIEQQVLRPIQAASLVWMLRDLEDSARMPGVSDILMDFEELVSYDDSTGTLSVFVMAGD